MTDVFSKVQGRVAQCDFCGASWDIADHTWTCFHAKPMQVRVSNGVVVNVDPQWLACNECTIMIDAKEWKKLAIRSADKHPDKKVTDYRLLVRTCYAINQAFASSKAESHLLHEAIGCILRLPQVH